MPGHSSDMGSISAVVTRRTTRHLRAHLVVAFLGPLGSLACTSNETAPGLGGSSGSGGQSASGGSGASMSNGGATSGGGKASGGSSGNSGATAGGAGGATGGS